MLKLATGKIRLIIAAVLIVVLLVAALLVVIIMAFSTSSAPAAAAECPPANPVPAAPAEAQTEQLANAKIIDDTAATLGLSGNASRVAIIAAIGESSLINIDYGDNAINPDGSVADSAGLFQQQPKTGWGTPEQVRDPVYATTSFLIGKAHDKLGGLVSVAGWEGMTATVAIHTVQINADPEHYAQYYAQADTIIAQAGIDVTRPATDVAGAVPVTDPAAPAAPGGCATAPIVAGEGGAQPLDVPYNMTDNYGPRVVPVAGASAWHPAYDLQNYPNPCGRPVYAVLPGTVTASDRLYLSVKTSDGNLISYLHMHKTERLVDVGSVVTAGQQIGIVGNEAPSTGCHLDIRMNVTDNTNPQVAALEVSTAVPGYVDPGAFMPLYGIILCDVTCGRNFTD
jgi:murein DD-endopeptidase MepM/ murein hydrolase activator NlpD